MNNLNNLDSQFLIIVPADGESILLESQNILWSRDYLISSLLHYNGIKWTKCAIASKTDTSGIYDDIEFIFKNTNIKECIIKESGQESAYKITKNGKTKLCIFQYKANICENSDIWSLNGNYFCMRPQKDYKLIESKEDIKSGMLVEILDGDNWLKVKVDNVEEQYEKMFKLFIKYKKVRTEVQ